MKKEESFYICQVTIYIFVLKMSLRVSVANERTHEVSGFVFTRSLVVETA